MTQAAREPRLAEKARVFRLAETAGRDRDEPAALGLDGLEDRAEAAGADALEEAITADRSRVRRRVGAGLRPRRPSAPLQAENEHASSYERLAPPGPGWARTSQMNGEKDIESSRLKATVAPLRLSLT